VLPRTDDKKVQNMFLAVCEVGLRALRDSFCATRRNKFLFYGGKRKKWNEVGILQNGKAENKQAMLMHGGTITPSAGRGQRIGLDYMHLPCVSVHLWSIALLSDPAVRRYRARAFRPVLVHGGHQASHSRKVMS
jgi:hypothetical protein